MNQLLIENLIPVLLYITAGSMFAHSARIKGASRPVAILIGIFCLPCLMIALTWISIRELQDLA